MWPSKTKTQQVLLAKKQRLQKEVDRHVKRTEYLKPQIEAKFERIKQLEHQQKQEQMPGVFPGSEEGAEYDEGGAGWDEGVEEDIKEEEYSGGEYSGEDDDSSTVVAERTMVETLEHAEAELMEKLDTIKGHVADWQGKEAFVHTLALARMLYEQNDLAANLSRADHSTALRELAVYRRVLRENGIDYAMELDRLYPKVA